MRLTVPDIRNSDKKLTGFSLLEIVVSLAILAVILGLGAFSVSRLFFEQDFERPAAHLKRMARIAAAKANLHGFDHVIRLEPGGAILSRAPSGIPIERVDFPSGVEVLVRPWGSNRWLRADGYDWVFGASGLSEPLGVRFERGDSSIELAFHPLGGGIRDEAAVLVSPES